MGPGLEASANLELSLVLPPRSPLHAPVPPRAPLLSWGVRTWCAARWASAVAVALCWGVEGVSSLDPGKSVAPGLIRAARVTRVPFHFGSLPEAVGSVGGTGWPWEGDGPRAPARAPCSLGRCWSWRREGDLGARSWLALRLCPDTWPGRGRLSLLVPARGVVLRAGAGPLRWFLGILSAPNLSKHSGGGGAV